MSRARVLLPEPDETTPNVHRIAAAVLAARADRPHPLTVPNPTGEPRP